MSATMPAVTASSANSAALHRDSGTPRDAGQLTGQSFDLDRLHRGEPARPARAVRVGQPGQPPLPEPGPPLADRVHVDPLLPGDRRVRRATGRRQDDRDAQQRLAAKGS
jgi:hypothetical protein